MKLGVVGLPNVGKSTLFNAITHAGAECANYPFCTIEPNVGVVAVPDERLDKLAALYQSKKVTPAAKGWGTNSSPISARLTRSCTSYAVSRIPISRT